MDKEKIISLIIMHEGIRTFLYNDLTGKNIKSTEGKVTVGYGYNIEERGLPLSVCKELLITDINDIIRKIPAIIKNFELLDSIRQAVLIDMAYNMGLNGLCKFKDMLLNISKNKFKEASSDMKNSLWAIQVKHRAETLSNMMFSGKWPDGI